MAPWPRGIQNPSETQSQARPGRGFAPSGMGSNNRASKGSNKVVIDLVRGAHAVSFAKGLRGRAREFADEAIDRARIEPGVGQQHLCGTNCDVRQRRMLVTLKGRGQLRVVKIARKIGAVVTAREGSPILRRQ